MSAHFEMFNSFITKHVELSEAELSDLNQKCTIVHFSKKTIIIKVIFVSEPPSSPSTSVVPTERKKV